ncbi:MAG: mannonate dehydratase [Armatimonadetes bacterium]|nr:mannonate dehydratase [Armatimonadota bacterium]
MRPGLGLYRHMLTADNFRFAKQAGATDIVAHMTDYFKTPRIPTAQSFDAGWGEAGDPERLWSFEELRDLRKAVNEEGLELAALENFDPAHWYDVLLDGPRKAQQLENVKTLIRNIGRAGIGIMGYNFSLAGVWGHVEGPYARGEALSVGFLGDEGPQQTPVPSGMIWNMVYDSEVFDPQGRKGHVRAISHDELWGRLKDFLDAVVPVAEESGVRLALHPDDPPMPTLRGLPRLVYQPQMYQRLLDLKPSANSGMEFCIGTLAEMADGDIYDVIDRYSASGRIFYVHLRNIRGKVPNYHEVFIDEGDVDMIRALRILHNNSYEGVIIPDHTPQMTCDAPWHAGMAYALGYIKAALAVIEGGTVVE